MAEKRYTAIFDAQDRVSDKLKRIEQATTKAKNAQENFNSGTKKAREAQERMKRSTDGAVTSIERMKRAMSTASTGVVAFGRNGQNAIKNVTSMTGKLASTLVSLPALIAGAGAAFGAWKLGDAVIGGALRQEMNETQLMGLSGDDRTGKALFDMIKGEAMNSTFATSEFMAAAKSYMGFTRDPEEMKGYLELTKRLALFDPIQGTDGAAVAIKEALSGDLMSLSERFEMPRSMLYGNGFDSKADAQTNFDAVMKTIEQQGLTSDAVKRFESTGMAQLQQFRNKSLDWLGQMGRGAVEEMKPFFMEVNKFFKSPDAKTFAGDMSKSIGDTFMRGITYLEDMNLKWSDFERILSGVGDIFGGLTDTFGILTGTFDGKKGKTPREQFEAFALSIERSGTAIDDFNKGLEPFMKFVRDFAGIATMFYGKNDDGTRKKGLVEKGAHWLSGRAFSGDAWTAADGQEHGFFKQMGPFFEMWDALNFNPNAGSSSRLPGSHMGGLSFVPSDGYPANLHKGERVLTAEQNRTYSKGANGVAIHIQNMHVRNDQDIELIGEAIARRLEMR